MPRIPFASLLSLGLSAACLIGAAFAADDAKSVTVGDIKLSVPKHWFEKEPSNSLRLAQFEIPPAAGEKGTSELVVSHFGNGGGDVEANIKRWVDQFAADERKSKITTGTSEQGTYHFVEITGTYNQPIGPPIQRKTTAVPNSRMLAVILNVKGKGNYFLKLAGPSKTLAGEATAFRASFGGDAKTEKAYQPAAAE